MVKMSIDIHHAYYQGCSGVGTRGNGVPHLFLVWKHVHTPLCTRNVTWRFRFLFQFL